MEGDNVSECIQVAGNTLLLIASGSSARGHSAADRKLFDNEVDILHSSFVTGDGTREFAQYHVQAVRIAVEKQFLDMIRFLLGKDTTHLLLESQQDLLQLALEACCYYEPDSLIETLELLLDHAANIDGLDSKGNSALFHACVNGQPRTFQLLVGRGANYSTYHQFEVDRAWDYNYTKEEKRDLLYITLDKFVSENRQRNRGNMHEYSVDIWENPFDEIVEFFLKQGLRVSKDHSPFVEFFYVACYHGNRNVICEALKNGVELHAGTEESSELLFGSALHAAVAGDHKDITRILLDHGANPRQVCWSRRKRFKQFIPPSFNSPISEWPKSLEAGMVLFEAGIDAQDQKTLLQESISQGNLNILRQLLDAGIRSQEIPTSSSLDVVKLLLEYSVHLPSEAYQIRAAQATTIDLLELLFCTYGPSIQPLRLVTAMQTALKEERLEMFEFLVTEFVEDINMVLPYRQFQEDELTNPLRIACEERSIDALKLLLRTGAKVECPGLPQTAIDIAIQASSGYHGLVMPGQSRIIQMLQLLLAHVNANDSRYCLMMPEDLLSGPYGYLVTSKKSTEHLRRAQQPSERMNWEKLLPSMIQQMPAVVGSEFEPHPTGPKSFMGVTNDLYEYRALVHTYDLRLLILEPCETKESPIKCRILNCNLGEKNRPEYEALSYAWGNVEKKAPIQIGEKRVFVTLNLWSALAQLRSTTERTLWIDAICINQDAVDDRNHQVGVMRDIYRNAKQVLIWLGTEADESGLVFEHIEKQRDYGRQLQAHPSGIKNARYLLGGHPANTLGAQTALAIKNFLYRPWFFRTWILQEVALAQHAIVLCGNDVAEWQELFLFTYLHHNKLPLGSGQMQFKSLCELVRSTDSINALKFSRRCLCSDPKDKVYGILGLFKRQLLPINYDIGLGELYRNFTQAVMEETGQVALLHWYGALNEPGVPSWVADFRCIGNARGFPERERWIGRNSNKTGTVTIEGDTLIVRGTYLESIEAVAPTLSDGPHSFQGTKEFTRTMREWETLAVQKMQTKRFRRAISDAFLVTLEAGLSFSHHNQSNEGSDRDDLKFQINEHADSMVAWYDRYGSGELKALDPEYFDHVRVVTRWRRLAFAKSNKEHFKMSFISEFKAYRENIAEMCHGRRFFTTDKGSIGLAPAEAQPEDSIVWFPSAEYPFVLRPRADGSFRFIGACYLYDFLYDLGPEQLAKLIKQSTQEYILR